MIVLDMGNICLKKVPAAYEARSVVDLAFKVVEKLKDEKRVGDLEKIIEESCASKHAFMSNNTIIMIKSYYVK